MTAYLIVGPDSVGRESMGRILHREGREVQTATPAAMESVLAKPFDMIVIVQLDHREAVKAMRAQPNAKTVIIAAALDLDDVRRAVAAGVRGYILTTMATGGLEAALQLVEAGETIIPSAAIKALLGPAGGQSATNPLTTRETEILQRAAEGLSNKAVGDALGISHATVKVHMKAILRKIGASNRTQAAAWAREHL